MTEQHENGGSPEASNNDSGTVRMGSASAESFPSLLRTLMTERGLSLRALAREIPIDPGQLSRVLNGKRSPSGDLARRCDELFGSGNRLRLAAQSVHRAADSIPLPISPYVDLLTEVDAPDRLSRAIAGDTQLDHSVIKWLEICLAEHRRVEDTLGAGPLYAITKGQFDIVTELAQDAPSRFRDRMVSLASQYSQFMAWMSNDLGSKSAAGAWYDRSHAWALEAGDANMASTTLSLKAHLAWSVSDGIRTVRLAEAALWPSQRTSPGVRGMATQMRARGHALSGDTSAVRSLLDEAEQHLVRAAAHPEDEPPWQYFYDATWLTLQRGMVELQLAEQEQRAAARAVALLRDGLGALPASYRRDRAWYGSCLARAHLIAGELEGAVSTASQFAADAVRLNRYAAADLRRLHTKLVSSGARVEGVDELGEVLGGEASREG